MIIKLISCRNTLVVMQKLILNLRIPDLLKSVAEFLLITVGLKSLLTNECHHAARQPDVWHQPRHSRYSVNVFEANFMIDFYPEWLFWPFSFKLQLLELVYSQYRLQGMWRPDTWLLHQSWNSYSLPFRPSFPNMFSIVYRHPKRFPFQA